MSRPARVWLAVGLAASLALSGCSLLADRTPPEDALTGLAEGLQAGDLSAVAITPGSRAAADRLPAVLEQLGGLRPAVEVRTEDVDRGRTRSAGVLTYTWTLREGAEPWTYATDVELVRNEDTDWEVVWTPEALAPGLGLDDVLDTRRVAAERGDVLGADGTELVTMRGVERVGLDKTQVEPDGWLGSAQALAELLEINPDNFTAAVEAAGDQAFVEGLVVRSSQLQVVERIRRGAGDIPGARLIGDERPLAINRELARPVLGVAGPATAELVEASAGDLVAGDFAGLSGLQARYDDRLRGTPGMQLVAETPDGSAGGTAEDSDGVLFTLPAEDGETLRLTLDPEAQVLADNILAGTETATGLVALRPSTGEVLAAASGPASEGFSTATEALYPPGSTFKIVTALALLRTGMTPDSAVECSPSVTVDGRVFTNYSDYPAAGLGRVSLEQAFASSCNTALARLHAEVGADGLQQAAASLGLDTDADLGYPFTLGAVPEAESETEQAAMMFGQARITANPLAIATVAASVVAGERVTPTLVVDGGTDDTPVAQPLTAAESGALQQLMRAVTTDGSGRLLADLPGDPVGSKTGTAEYGTEDPPATHGWMVAYQGDLAVAVFVEGGESGSGSAGPLLEEFLAGYDG